MPLSAFDTPIELKSGEDFSDDASDVVTKALSDLTATVEERFKGLETKAAESAALVSRLDKIETRLNRPGIIGRVVETKEDATAIEKKAFDAFARGIAYDQKSLSVAGTGGVTVPTPLMSELLKNLVLYSPMRTVARIMSVGSETVTLPKRTANLTAAHVEETAARSESTPMYAAQTIATHEIGVVSDVTIKMLEDSVFDLASNLVADIGEEFGRLEGAKLVNGTGTGEARGILYNPAAGSIMNARGAEITADDLIDLYYSLPGFYAANGKWLMNRKTMSDIRKLKTNMGEYLWQDSLANGSPATILGAPVVEMNDFPNVAPSTISIAFGDFQQAYRILDRVSINVVRDDFTQRSNGIIRFHARRRYGGDIVKDEAVRYLRTTAS